MSHDADDTLAAIRAEAGQWLVDNRALLPAAGPAHEPMGYRTDPARQDWVEALRAGGWLCLSWPREYGGRGLDVAAVAAVDEMFAQAGTHRARLGMGEHLVAPAVLAHGSDEQKQRLLPPILSGAAVYCQGFSEPEAGSDLARLRTTGTVSDDEVVIDGHKIWQSGSSTANMIFVLCRTDPDAPRHAGLSYVLVPMTDNNVTVEPIRMMTGDWGFGAVHLDHARAPLDNVIGGLGRGWQAAMTTLEQERAGEAVTQYYGYQRELRQLARALGLPGDTTDVPSRLIDAYLQVQLMRSTGRFIADALVGGGAGKSVGAALAVDKVNWSEYHAWFGEMAVQELGLDGVLLADSDGYELSASQRVLLESRGRRIARGTNQVQRDIIAQRVLGLPR